jgi:hypothetical protein
MPDSNYGTVLATGEASFHELISQQNIRYSVGVKIYCPLYVGIRVLPSS